MTDAEFYTLCDRTDWYYNWSDDERRYTAGRIAADKLRASALTSPEKWAIYQAWQRYMFSGKPWGTERAPRPEPPAGEIHLDAGDL
jgi:hypothetical protein